MALKVDQTEDWIAHYVDPKEVLRRKVVLSEKLEKMGVLSVAKPSSILDVCCGNGEGLQILKEQGFENIRGFDQTKFPGFDEDVEFYQGTALDLPFANDSFDVLTNIHSAHHLGDIDELLVCVAEMFRVLKPGGTLFLFDFKKSLILNSVFALMRLGFVRLTRYQRHYSDQLIAEWDIISRFLRNQNEFELGLRQYFRVEETKFDPWHMCWSCTKPS